MSQLRVTALLGLYSYGMILKAIYILLICPSSIWRPNIGRLQLSALTCSLLSSNLFLTKLQFCSYGLLFKPKQLYIILRGEGMLDTQSNKQPLAFSLYSMPMRCTNVCGWCADGWKQVSVKRSTVGKVNNVRVQALPYTPIAAFIVEVGFMH
jgi:hypothetical protein